MTTFIAAARGSGKTTMLIEWMGENADSVMVCHSLGEANRLRQDYKSIRSDRFVTVGERQYYGQLLRRGAIIVVDNVDLMIKDLFGYPVEYATLSHESLWYKPAEAGEWEL